ncbi:hypothetical protein L593_08225 [Salinarchaeum sp. Harcht-Bsk1]|uniref:hypothetical protein n=1 Tax=Salinarchaeum sp. Harcht-Bsk1 TaxID=1333523 RepID=UPI000342336B|nr:hypothetical protein [Salinarchaeum sp. Harcht-Bsk1]AGN01590.1 hypothetical protein L593_08225 [Salinarchaeum sp. Harcht-Bsk1]
MTYSLGSDEEMAEAVINAFHAANIDVFDKPTELDDWVSTDIFETLHWTDRPVFLSTRIWDQRVVLCAEEVRIYTTGDLE